MSRRTALDYPAFKVILIGKINVGKTSILQRFMYHTFSLMYMSTIGVDYEAKVMEMDDGQEIRMQLWDTAGQERFRTFTTHYYRGAHGIFIVYDISDRSSFEELRTIWLPDLIGLSEPNSVKFILGNKMDLEAQRCVEYDEGVEVALQFGATFMEVSAQSGANVDEAFMAMAKKIRAYVQERPKEHPTVDLSQPPPDSNCCK